MIKKIAHLLLIEITQKDSEKQAIEQTHLVTIKRAHSLDHEPVNSLCSSNLSLHSSFPQHVVVASSSFHNLSFFLFLSFDYWMMGLL